MSFSSFEYNSFYYSNLCHVCKEANQNLKRCAICKIVAYCSKDHQKLDWRFHKDLCKAVAKTDNRLNYSTVNTFENFKIYNINRSILWHAELSRKLLAFECQMWMFPRVCAVCFSKHVTIDCLSCLNVSYCSEIHKNIHAEQHSNFCGALKLCMDRDLFCFHSKVYNDDIIVSDFDSDINKLPKNLHELMEMYEKDNVSKKDNSDEIVKFIRKSDLIAPIATILYGMEKTGILTDRFLNKPNLIVHIVGAGLTEMGWLWKLITELPFHWIKDLKRLDFYLVGPELHHEGITEKFAQQLCDSCKARSPVTRIIFHSKLYHEIANALEKPDIVVALNSGLHEFGLNPWHESIPCLTMHSNVPLLLTAYTFNEIKEDVCTVKSKSSRSISTVLEPQRNPFSNMTPIRDWETENNPVFYVNGYIAILRAE